MLRRMLTVLLIVVLSGCVPSLQPTPEPTPPTPSPPPQPPYVRTLEEVGLGEGETALFCPPADSCWRVGREVALVAVDSLSNPTTLTLALAPTAKDAGGRYPEWEESRRQTFSLHQEGKAFLGFEDGGNPNLVITPYGTWLWENGEWVPWQPSTGGRPVAAATWGPSGIGPAEEVPPDGSPLLPSLLEPRPLSPEIPEEILSGLTAGGEFLSKEQLTQAYAGNHLFYEEGGHRVIVLPKDQETVPGGNPEIEAAIKFSTAPVVGGVDQKAGQLVIPVGDEFLVVVKGSRGKGVVVYHLYRLPGTDRWNAYKAGHPENPTLGDVFFHPQMGVVATDGGFNITYRYNPETKKWEWLGGENGDFIPFETTADPVNRTIQTLDALLRLCTENYSWWDTYRNPYKINEEDVARLVETLREGKAVEGVEVEEGEAYAIYHTPSVSVFVDKRNPENQRAVYILAHGEEKDGVLSRWFAEMWQRLTTENWLPPELVLKITQYTPVGGVSPIDLAKINYASSHTVFSCQDKNKETLVFGATYFRPDIEDTALGLDLWLLEAAETTIEYHREIGNYYSSYLEANLPDDIHLGVRKILKDFYNRSWVVITVGANLWVTNMIENNNLPTDVKNEVIQILKGQRWVLLYTDYLPRIVYGNP